MGFNSNMANREVCDLIFLDYATKKPFLNLDYANMTTTELTGETMYAYGGKGHPKRIAFDGEKAGTLTIETQMQSFKLWELLTGGETASTAKFYKRVEKVTASDGAKITLEEAPIEGTVVVFKASDDCGAVLESTVAGKEVTLDAPLGSETAVVVYYMKEATNVKALNVKSTTFPKDFVVYGDTVMKTEDGEVLPYRITAYKVHPQATMSLAFSNNGDPGAVTITCDLLADADNNILDLVLEEA